jgi:hypothetical protein
MTEHGACWQGAVPSTNAIAGEMNVTLVALFPGGTGPPADAGEVLVLVVGGGVVKVEVAVLAGVV